MPRIVNGYNVDLIKRFFSIISIQEMFINNDFDNVFTKENIIKTASIMGITKEELTIQNIPSFIIEELHFPLLEKMNTLYGGMFSSDSHIDRLVIPKNIRQVQCAAINCQNLKIIEIEGIIEYTDSYRFVHNCPNLESIIFLQKQKFSSIDLRQICTECPNLKIYGLD